jgi:hypothetical protein
VLGISFFLSFFFFFFNISTGFTGEKKSTGGLQLELCVGYFQDRVLWTLCLDWPWTSILLISASWEAKMTGLTHWRPASLFYLFIFFLLKTWFHYVSQTSLELTVLLSQPLECWDYRGTTTAALSLCLRVPSLLMDV